MTRSPIRRRPAVDRTPAPRRISGLFPALATIAAAATLWWLPQAAAGAVVEIPATGTVVTNLTGGASSFRLDVSDDEQSSSLTYHWTKDGVALTDQTSSECTISWALSQSGSHRIECTVSNETETVHFASWDVFVRRRLWVKANGTASSPTGADAAHAFTSLQQAVDAALDGDLVWVLPGSYAPFYWNSSGSSHVSIQAAEGFSGTVIDGWLETDEGYVDPVIWGNWENREAVQIVGFTLDACAASGVSLLNCLITNYDSWTSYFYPVEIPFRNDRLENCLVTGNSVSSMFASCEFVNCTVVGNVVQTTLPWDDPWMLQDMTIGFIGPDCSVVNSIVRFNCDESGEEINFWNGTSGWYGGNLPSFGYAATFPMPETQSGPIVTNNPAFVDAVLGDWRLATGSPCLNRGLNSIVSSEFDLAGAPRIQGTSVDLGCYEGGVTPDIPGIPGNVRASQGTASEVVTVTWSPANRAQWYQVFRSASSNNVGVAIGRVDGFSFTDTNAVANVEYWYSVRATNASGEGEFAKAVSGFRTPPLSITTEWMAAAKAGDEYSCQLEAEGGRQPYEWMLTSFKDYSMTRPANSFEAVSGSSVVSGDDSCSSYSLPFAFPFFGDTYETVWINSNGTLNFDEYFSDYSVDEISFMNRPMIAAMWRDLTGSVYVSQQTQDSVTFRWSGSYYSGSTINVSATLYADGRIVVKHGSGNASGGLVGVSDGNGTAIYENISSSLSSTDDFVFAPVADADWMSIDPATGLVSGRPLANQTNCVTAIVTDSLGNVALREYSIEVTDCTNSHPVVQFCLPSERVLKVFPQETVEFSVEAVDPDGNDIVYTWIVDGVTNMTGLATAFSWTPDVESSGTHTIACRVSDGYWDDLAATWTVSLPDWFVSPDGSPSNSGKSLASAFDSLQAAIDAASAGDTIYVADGTYTPVSTANKTVRILAAPGASPVIDGGGTNRCAFVGNGAGYTNTVFCGFTLCNGYSSNGNGGAASGGTFENCTIENSRVGNGYYGGGTYYANLDNCTVRNCRAGYGGGTYYGEIRNSVIRDCEAVTYGGGTFYGTYYDSTIRDNRAKQGSGVYCGTYTRCTITGNHAQEQSALHSVTLNYCISWGNTFADGLNADTWRTSLTASYSCIQNGATGTGNSSSDPILVEHPDGHIGPLSPSPALGRGDRSGGLDGVLVRVSATGPGHVSPSVVSAAGSNVVVTATLPNAYHAFSGFIVNGVEVTAGVEQDGLDYRLAFTVPDGMSLVDVVAEFPPTTFYVKPDGNNTNDGLSWATARKTIQSAVNSAVSFDTILVTNGTYGAFSATNNSSFVIRGVEGADNTIVDGGGSSRCAKLGAVQQHTLTTLEGLTLTNGFVNGSGGGSYGGTLRNCILTGNRTSSNSSSYYGGGAAYSLLCNCRVENNWGYYGGGTCYGATENCVITNNSAYSGGGTYYGSHTGDIIASNRATSGEGGGAYYGAVERCVVFCNTASSLGGGVSRAGATNCLIRANTAESGGGAYAVSATLVNCQLNDNIATSSGGGANGGTLVNCTVVGNRAVRGAGAESVTATRTVSWDNALTQSGGVLTSEDGATNPMLVLGDDGIYHLSEHSPFIDAGTGSTAGLPATDLAGGARIQGAAIDCGAVEGGVVGNWVGLSNDGYGSASGAFAVPDGGSVILRAEQGDGEHAFLGFFAGGEALGGVVSSGLVHEVTFAPTAKTTDVVAKFERRTFHVSPDGDDAADGRSWETARRTINAALASAHTGDTVLVADGTYSPFTFSRNDFVAIRSVNGHEATIIDGGGTQRCATFGGTSTVSNDSNAITNAVLEGFTLRNGRASNGGGGQYGTYRSCRFENNVATSSYGGGLYYGAADSCVFWNNQAVTYGGGAYNATIRNCTVVGNRVTSSGGYGGGCYGGIGYNSIIYGNAAFYGTNTYSWTSYNNFTSDSALVYPDAGDVRLRVGSPRIDAGNNSYVRTAFDIAGNARIQNGTVDVGAYEGGVPGFVVGTAIVGYGDVSPKYVLADATDDSIPSDAEFTAVETDRPFLGFETNGVFVSWEEVGDTLAYAGVTADATVTLHFATNLYVNAVTGDDANGGFTPDTAKKTLQVAIDLAKAGETVYVAPGSYESVTTGNKAIRVIATEGWEKTAIDGGGTNRCVYAGEGSAGTDTKFDGFTIQNGRENNGYGAGARGGTFYNCVFKNNVQSSSSYAGGATSGSSLYNCLLTGNRGYNGGGANSGLLVNCTVVGNTASNLGGGTYNGATVRNSIVWGNFCPNSYSNYNGCTFTYSCTLPAMSGTGNISSDPRFVDPANGDYRLLNHSPCIDAGSASYATGETDLLGNPRVVGAAPDMGCYEGGVELPLPETPQGFSAEDGRRIGFVRMSWDSADWAWSYRVERSEEPDLGTVWTEIGTTTSLFFDDETAVPGEQYLYRVWGVNPEGASEAPSDPDSGSCLAEFVIAEPSLETATAGIPYAGSITATGGAGGYVWRTGADDYTIEGASSSYAPGDRSSIGVSGDDVCGVWPLPFDFPFYGRTFNKVWVSSNGTLTFDSSLTQTAYSQSEFQSRPMIAVMWRDIVTGSAGLEVATNGTDSITFYWNAARYYSGGAAVNFSATLFRDGTIVCSYSEGNANGGFVGVSAGDGSRSRYIDLQGTSMANADDIVFRPQDLPAGLSLSADGTISGTPTEEGTFSFTAFVSDSLGNGTSRLVSITVESNPNMRRVDFVIGGHGTRVGGGALVQGVMLGEAAVAPSLRAASGWVFDGWDADFSDIQDNMTVTAQWRPAKPALRVVDVAAPAAANAGDEVEVTWALANWGNAAFTGSLAEEIRLVPVGGGSAVTVASVSFADVIERDGTAVRSARFTLPKKGMEGQWTVRVVSALRPSVSMHETGVSADAPNALAVSAIPLPDLAVADVAATPGALVPGGTVAVSYAVNNDGAADADGTWTDSVYLVSDESGAEVKLADLPRTGTLAAGASRAESAELAIPETIALTGNVRVKVVADSADAVVEADDTDNSAVSESAVALAQRLFATAASASVSEANGSVRLTVKRSGPRGAALVVSLLTTPSGELSVPETVTIPSGNASANVTARGIDNSTVEGPRQVSVTASADGFDAASAEITVTDNETPHLYLSLSGDLVREGGTLSGSVRRELVTDSALVVYLSGPSTSRCSYPSSVTIPAGAGSATFEIAVPDNTTSQREVAYTLRASASGHVAATAPLSVEDDDIPGFTLELYPEMASEGAGPNAVYATLTRVDQSQIAKDVTVRLSQSPAGNLILPASIKVPKYTMAVRFAVGTVDNALDDGDRDVTIDGAVVIEDCGCDGQPSTGDAIRAVMTVIDDDGPALSLKAEPATMREGLDEAGFLVLSHNSALADDLEVALSFDVEGEIDIPATATIPAGVSSVRIPVRTLDDGVEDGAKLVSVYAEDQTGVFAPASTWVQVSDQNLPDLMVSSVAVPASVVAMERFAVTFVVTNQGFMARSGAVPYAVHLVRGATGGAVTATTLQTSGSLTGGIGVGGVLAGEAVLTAPELPGDFRVIVVVDPDGTISELDSANNTTASQVFSVSAAYAAEVAADADAYLPGETITITGVATLAGGTPAALVPVDVYMLRDSYRKTLPATTASDGSFAVTYTPSAGEAGHYRIGACYPGVGSSAEQDEFDVMGMKRTSTSAITWDIALGDRTTRTVSLKNLSAAPLTGLSATFTGVPEECSLEYTLPGTIPANGTVTLSMTATATGMTEGVDYDKFSVRIESEEGVALDIPLYFHSQAQRAQLRATPTSINTTMMVGAERMISVTIYNDGKGDSGAVTASVPSARWLRVVSGAATDNLAPGESMTVTLLLSPEESDGLTLNSPLSGGSLAVNCANGNGCSVPLRFTPVSESTGGVVVDAVDNYTYTLESAPHLEGATVRITNPYTGALVASGTTGPDGLWTGADIPEGRYQLTITATNHDTYADELVIDPGTTTRVTAFLQYKLVTADWTVVRNEIEDEYELTLLLEYETQVPAPVIRVQMPEEFDTLAEGESVVFNIHVENTGLIAAETVWFEFPSIPEHAFECSETGFRLAAGEARDVSVTFRHLAPIRRAMLLKAASTGGTTTRIGTWLVQTLFDYICGDHKPSGSVPRRIRYGEYVEEDDGEDDVPPWIVGPVIPKDPTPGRNPVYPIGPSGPGNLVEAVSRFVSKFCDVWNIPCVRSVIGCAADVICTLIPGSEGVDCVLGIVDCGKGLYELKNSTGFIDATINTAKAVYNCGLSIAGCAGKIEGAVQTVAGCVGNIGADCVIRPIANKIAEWFSKAQGGKRGVLLKADGSSDAEISQRYPAFAASIATAQSFIEGWESWFCEIFGDLSWAVASEAELRAFLTKCSQLLQLPSDRLSVEALSSVKPECVSDESLSVFVSRWNNYLSGDQGDDYATAEPGKSHSVRPDLLLACSEQIEICNDEISKWGYETLEDFMREEAQKVVDDLDNYKNAVCASITLKFSQTLALTREAFDGTLTMYNGHSSVPITALKLDISVLDADGNERKDLFEVFASGVSGDMADGEDVLAGGLSVPAGGTGSAMVRFIPERGAAPTEDTLYRFGGTVTYIDPFSGEQATVKLTPVSLTVSPSPYLHLDYFVQRDVYADDPFTPDVVEASMPAELAVLVRNNGGGEARNVRISSVQPETVRNEKGLLASFRLADYTDIRSALDGAAANLPISDVVLGTIDPSTAKVAQWWLTSSIEGHFTGLTATVTPVNSWNTPDTSLVDPDVGTHKLVRSIVADGDALPDFLTSEEDDLYGRPDTIYTAAGEVTEVHMGTLNGGLETASPLTGAEIALEVTMTPARSGWNYAELALSGLFRYEIAKIERADGSEVPLRNAWITDRTFRDGLTPLLVEKFHIVDEFASDDAASYTVTLLAKPTDGPAVAAFEDVANGAVESAVRNAVTVVFSTAVDPATFTVADLSLVHQGAFVADLSALAIAPETGDETGTRFVVSGLAAVCPEPGRNELTVQCAGISNLSGSFGVAGRSVAWTYSAAEAPYIIGIDGVPRRAVQELDAVTVVLSLAVDPASFTTAALRLDGAAVAAGVSVRALDESGTRFAVEGLAAAQASDGEHVLSVDATALRSLDGEAGVAGGGDVARWRRDTVAPRLLAVEREMGLGGTRFLVTFSEDVDEGTVTVERFALAHDAARSESAPSPTRLKAVSPVLRAASGSSPIPETATLENLGGGVWGLSGIDSALAGDGAYTLTFTADGVADEAGNEADGQGSVSWTQDTTAPDPVHNLRISPDLGASDTDGITSEANVTVIGTLPDDAASVEIAVRFAGGGETTLVPAFAPESTALAAAVTLPGAGNMTLVVRCADESGNASGTELALFLDPLSLTATLSGAPSDAADVADAITLAFSDAVDAATVALSDFTLYRDGAAVALAGTALAAGGNGGLETTSPLVFTLSGLGAICGEDGLYRLVYDGSRAAKALTGRKMDSGSAEISAQWTRYAPDLVAPFVTDVRIDASGRDGEFFDTVSTIDVSFSEPMNVPDLLTGGWIGQAVKIARVGADGGVESVLLPEAGEIVWNEETATLRWTLPAGLVGPGDWRVTLDAGFITDAADNALRADGADATHPGLVRFDADAPVSLSVASYAMPSFGDFDGDGDADLLVGEKSGDGLGRVRLFRNTGRTGDGKPVFETAGTLAAAGAEIALAAQGCQGASVALLPRSGVADLVVGDAFGNVTLYPAEDGGWGEGRVLFAGDDEDFGSARAVVSASDILGSGRASLVFGGMDGKFRRSVGILRPNAETMTRLAWLEGTDGEPLRVAAGRSAPAAFDLNGDAIPDLVSGDTAGNVWAFLGDGRLSWQNEPILLVAAGSLPDRSRVAVSDFTGTGAPTLAVGRSDGSVRLHSGSATPSPSFDFTVLRTPPTLAEALDAPGLDWATGGAEGSHWFGAWTERPAAAKGDDAAMPSGDGAWIETAFSGAGMVSFRLFVPDGQNSGSVSFAVDGVEIGEFGSAGFLPADASLNGGSEGRRSPDRRDAARLESDPCPGIWIEYSLALASGEHEARWVWTAPDGATAPLLDAVTWESAPWTDSAAAVAAEAEFRVFLETNGLLASGADEVAFVDAALSDADGDGQNAWAEFVAMTDPTDPDDRLVADIEIGDDGAPVVTWDPHEPAERDYVLEGADDLSGPYAPVDSAAEDGAAPSRFYRVKVFLK